MRTKIKSGTLPIVIRAYQDALDDLYALKAATKAVIKKYGTFFNRKAGILTIRGKSHTFRGKSLKLLKFFYDNPYTPLSYEEISFGVWGRAIDPKTIQQMVSSIKKIYGLTVDGFIVSCGGGYVFYPQD